MKFTKIFIPIIALALALILAGCTANINSFEFAQDGKVPPGNVQGSPSKATNVMVFYVKDSPLTTRKNQEADGQVPISFQGSNSATGKQTKPSATFNPVNVIKEAKEIIDVIDSPAQIEESQLDNDDASNIDAATWKHTKTYNMQEISHGRPFFRLGIPGEEFGKSVLFTDDKGNTFFVPDTTKDYGDKAQQFFFNGKGQVEHTFDGNASMFWYSTGSHSITAHFNGVTK